MMGNKYRKKGRYQGSKRSSGIRWYWWVLGFAVWFGYMWLAFRPELQPMRDTILWKLLGKLALSGAVLYFAWIFPGHPPKQGQFIMTLMAFVFWQRMVLPSQRLLLLHITVLVFWSAGYLLYLMIRQKKNSEVLMFATCFFAIMLLDFMGEYVYVDGRDHHWQISLVLALLAGGAACYLIFNGFIRLKDNRMSEKVCWCIMAAFVSFIVIWATANNLNYMLDVSEPEHFEACILDKEIDSSGKTTEYEMTVVIGDQQIQLDVSQSDYFRYEIGETLPVELYEGFFNDPYYINE